MAYLNGHLLVPHLIGLLETKCVVDGVYSILVESAWCIYFCQGLIGPFIVVFFGTLQHISGQQYWLKYLTIKHTAIIIITCEWRAHIFLNVNTLADVKEGVACHMLGLVVQVLNEDGRLFKAYSFSTIGQMSNLFFQGMY